MTEYYHAQKNIKEDDFIDIRQLQSSSYVRELELIEMNLNKLQETMLRYLEDMISVWDNEIVQFIKSQDCLTLQYLTHYDYNKFIDFMTTQETFKLMRSAKDRLLKRKEIIENKM